MSDGLLVKAVATRTFIGVFAKKVFNTTQH